MILVCKKIKSLTRFELFFSEGHIEKDMASCSKAFRKPKKAEEERKLIENATPKVNTCSNKVVFENFSGIAEWEEKQESSNRALRPVPKCNA